MEHKREINDHIETRDEVEVVVVASSQFLADPETYVKEAESRSVEVERDGEVVLSFGTFIKPNN